MEKYYEDDNFLYLVVEVTDLYFGFDLSTVRDHEIAVKIVTQSYYVFGIDGKHVDAIIGVGTLKDGYVRRVPLPRVIPRRQSAPTSDLWQ